MKNRFFSILLGCFLIASCGSESTESPSQDSGDCFMGRSFAECPGDKDPKLFCRGGWQETCIWVSNGNPLGEYSCEIDASCDPFLGVCAENDNDDTSESIQSFLKQRDLEPWNRTRDMNIDLQIDPSITPAQDSCTSTNELCGSDHREEVVERGFPGTYWVVFGDLWRIEIEVDFAANDGKGKARACLYWPIDNHTFPFQCDYLKSRKTPCARSGVLKLSARPTKDTLHVAGEFDLAFDHSTNNHELADGFHITGAFTGE